jgi:hypothetical protein
MQALAAEFPAAPENSAAFGKRRVLGQFVLNDLF